MIYMYIMWMRLKRLQKNTTQLPTWVKHLPTQSNFGLGAVVDAMTLRYEQGHP